MTKAKYIIFTILLLLLCLPGKAQYNFRSIDTRTGLCDNFVRSILKDQQGFMWFGTMNGISRYDGFNNRPYTLIEKNGKANNNVLLIQQDKSGQMWITTYDGSIFYYNAATDCMENNAAERLVTLGIRGKIGKLCIDKDKNLWLIQGKKVSYYIFEAHRLYQMTLPEEATWISCRAGVAYALTAKGRIYHINPLQKSAYLVCAYPANAQNLSLYQDSRNNIWVYDKYVCGLYKKSMTSKKLEKVNNENVCSISEDNQGNLWIGTNSNGIIIQHNDGTLLSITRNENTLYPLTSNHINTIEIDDNNMAWIGTSKLGIAYTNLNNTSITIIPTPFNEDIGFLCQDAADKLWIGYDGQGLYDSTSRKLYKAGNSTLTTNNVIGGKTGYDNCIYLGTYGGGVYRLTADNSLTRIWKEHPQLDYTRRIIQDKKGNFWIGATMNGLCLITPDKKFHNFTFHNSALRTNAITDMAYAEKENLILVATGTGLYTVNDKKQIQQIKNKELLNATINVVCTDTRGLRWISTNEELKIYDAQFHLLKSFGKAEGLNNVLAMTTDQQGQIWLTTSDAIYCFIVEKKGKDKYNFHFRKFINADGLGDITFCKKAIYCMKNGDILAGGCGKYARLTPSLLAEAARLKKVIFTELRVKDKVLPFSSSTHSLEFENGVDFSLFVSTLDFTQAAHTQFAYQLQDHGEWIPVEGNCITLTNLSFGTYTLRVKALDGSDETLSSITFTIRPPFWLSGYAICLYLLLAIILIGIGIRRYKRKMTKAKLKLMALGKSQEDATTSTSGEKASSPTRNEEPSYTWKEELINHATEIIEKHLDDIDFSVENFSEEMGLSRSALYKKLMSATDKSPLEFMRMIRLRHGLELVKQGKLSVAEIAYSVGLSPKQFSKFFKEEYGILPSKYKNQEPE